MLVQSRTIRTNKGFTLTEVMLVVFVLALSAMIFAAAFPSGQISRIKAAHMSYAVSLAQQKIEEIRSGGYGGVLISDPVDTPLSELPSGNERVEITQYSPNVKKIEVTITWGGYRKVGGDVSLITLISDHT